MFRARAYGEALAHEMGDAIVAPVLPFAPAGSPSEAWPGTISLSSETFSRVNEEVVRSLIGGGFKRLALLNDHGGGQTELRDLAVKLDAEFASRGVRTFFISDNYARARKEIEADIRASGKVASGHGGLWDTAETMAVKPSAVRPEKFHPGTLTQEGNGPVNEEGFSGDPTTSSQALGRKFGALRVRLAAAELRNALSSSGACGNGAHP
jgi:creatinine amidohydrolase/Fe(II)-dependent formamide hydrolase-like protein